jgi:hypothetical protein
MNSIKINRAAKLSRLSQSPRTWQAVIEAIPADVKAACTAAQIAKLADAMRGQFEAGHTAGFKDAA